MTPDLNELAAALAAAEQDVLLLERLQSAKDRFARLTKDYDRAERAHEREEAAKEKEAYDNRFAGLIAVRVTGSGKDNSIHQNYRITCTRDVYDTYAQRGIPKEVHYAGFLALPPDVFGFLIERHPEQVPAEIMALAPGDPEAAFSRYFQARRRGYVAGPSA